jgi:two-component system CheB/CheR fusion protein
MRTRKTRKARTASDSTAVHEGGAAFPHLIVAIGASAGGLDALRRFFAGVPADTGFAFVVLFHADPGQPSLLADLLAAGAHVPVVRIAPGMALQADRIHVMAPGTLPELRQGRLVLASPGQGRDVRHPIDAFFVSLARDQGERAVGIILSGALDDGSLGVCAIKDAGGHTLVERPDTAQFDGMPSHAVATGCVDDCAPVEELAAVLLQYVRSSTWPEPAGDQTVDPSIAARLPAICAVLQRSTGNDFGGYKRTTLIRRIQHRMQMLRISDVDVYVRALSDDPHEPELLLKEMLIGVTQFFRDPEAFDAIDRLVLTPLFAEPFADRTVRVWVAGCATGEEAYSLAILLYEHMERCTVPPRRVTVFATDIDRAALNVARRGRYPLSIANDITPARLERFFVRDGDAYEAHKSVRDLCTFSRHNVTQDPPFARLNLLCCRNLLIYFDVQMQRQLMPLFHYALLPGGCLMLGPSEQASETQFTVLDKKTRLYRRRDLGSRQPVVFPLPRLTPATAPARMQEPVAAGEQTVVRTLERILLNQYTPASVVLTDLGEIVYTAGPIDRFLALAPGLPTMDFYQLARVDVRPELRSLVRRISTSPGGIATTEMPPAAGECLRIEARRLTELTSADLTLVVFRPSPLAAPEIASQAVEGPDDPMQLRLQLESTRQHLHAAVEEVEHANQDLRVSNEELLSLNEELQSANEELQTAKEEMQSVNEELETVNSELHAKLEELGVTHADLQNLFRAAEIATLFLDRGLTIQRFTPASRALFRLIDSDVGRPILDIVARFGVVDLAGAIETVLATLAVLEREVVTDDGKRTFLMRILPYHTIMGLVDGVVLTFVDVTELKWAQAAAAQLAAIVRSSLDAIFSVSADGLVTSWNAGAEAVYGYAPAEIVGRSAAVLDVAMLTEALHQPLHALGATGAIPRSARQRRKDGQEIDVLVTLSPLTDAQGRSVGVSVIARDVTAELEAEAARQAVRTAHQLQEAATLAQLRHEVAERHCARARSSTGPCSKSHRSGPPSSSQEQGDSCASTAACAPCWGGRRRCWRRARCSTWFREPIARRWPALWNR